MGTLMGAKEPTINQSSSNNGCYLLGTYRLPGTKSMQIQCQPTEVCITVTESILQMKRRYGEGEGLVQAPMAKK